MLATCRMTLCRRLPCASTAGGATQTTASAEQKDAPSRELEFHARNVARPPHSRALAGARSCRSIARRRLQIQTNVADWRSLTGGRMNWRLAFAAAAAALISCGGPFNTGDTEDGGNGTTTTPPPQVAVVSPDDHHEFDFENEDDEHHGDDEFDIEVHVEHANVAQPGRCSGAG